MTPGELAELPPPHRLEDIAARLAARIERRNPGGPTLLASFCLRTFLAVETARLLRTRGHAVPLVVLADPSDPEIVAQFLNPAAPEVLVARAGVHLRKLSSLRLRDLGPYLAGRGQALVARVREQFGRNVVRDKPILAAGARHRFEPYEGALLLVRCASAEKLPDDAAIRSWRRIAKGPLTIRSLPGGHVELFDHPVVPVLAQLLREEIAAALRPETIGG